MPRQAPILWSFRRCPYAMRARLAIASARIPVEHREILLRDKPAEFLATSPKGTVPVIDVDGLVIEESFDVMLWALNQNDPENWLDVPPNAYDLIAQAEGPFKTALDRYKYASRIEDSDPKADRAEGSAFLVELDTMLCNQSCLAGTNYRLTDMAILPFVRQFAHVDLDWFNAQPWPDLSRWLEDFKSSDRFRGIMAKYPLWTPKPVS
ncbi:MAG: glutathione S-transferase [Marinosulfonomonas sp.]|nr:glutathione S-transferase [Marinosulfonomonas sp.]